MLGAVRGKLQMVDGMDRPLRVIKSEYLLHIFCFAVLSLEDTATVPFPGVEECNQECLADERLASLGLCASLASFFIEQRYRAVGVIRVDFGEFITVADAQCSAYIPLYIFIKVREATE